MNDKHNFYCSKQGNEMIVAGDIGAKTVGKLNIENTTNLASFRLPVLTERNGCIYSTYLLRCIS